MALVLKTSEDASPPEVRILSLPLRNTDNIIGVAI